MKLISLYLNFNTIITCSLKNLNSQRKPTLQNRGSTSLPTCHVCCQEAQFESGWNHDQMHDEKEAIRHRNSFWEESKAIRNNDSYSGKMHS